MVQALCWPEDQGWGSHAGFPLAKNDFFTVAEQNISHIIKLNTL